MKKLLIKLESWFIWPIQDVIAKILIRIMLHMAIRRGYSRATRGHMQMYFLAWSLTYGKTWTRGAIEIARYAWAMRGPVHSL